MSRSTEQRVKDALNAIARCTQYTNALDNASTRQMAADAIERNLQILGEAVNHLPLDVTRRYPEVPWPQIRGFRNILVHEYFGVEPRVIEDVVQNHLPSLEKALMEIRKELRGF